MPRITRALRYLLLIVMGFSAPPAGTRATVLATPTSAPPLLTSSTSHTPRHVRRVVADPNACPGISGWDCGEIGSPPTPGTQSFNGTTWTVQGSGNLGYSNGNDAFHYVWQDFGSDSTSVISAHVSSVAGNGTTLRAGIMIRNGTDPAAWFYAILVDQNHNVTVESRNVSGGLETAQIPQTNAQYIQIKRSGFVFNAFTSVDGQTWTQLQDLSGVVPGPTVGIDMSHMLVGLFVTSGDNSLTTGTFDSVTLSAGGDPVSSCPGEWTCQDISGPIPGDGDHNIDGSSWALDGGGGGLCLCNGGGDQFHYVYQNFQGNGQLTVHLSYNRAESSALSESGIMVRQSTASASVYYALMILSSGGNEGNAVTWWRGCGYAPTCQLGFPGKNNFPTMQVPQYLRLTWQLGVIGGVSAYASSDGMSWTLLPFTPGGPFTALTGPVTAGMLTTGGNPPITGVGTFDSAVATPLSAPPTSSVNAPDVLPTTCSAAKPVNCDTGFFSHTFDDMAIPGRGIPLDFAHTYNSSIASDDGPLGYGWTDRYNLFLTQDPYGDITLHEPNGTTLPFTPPPMGQSQYQAPSWVLGTLVQNQDGTLTFTRLHGQDQDIFYGLSQSPPGKLKAEVDRYGYQTTLAYNANGQLTSVTDPEQRALTFAYNASGVNTNHITSITDPANRLVQFAYDATGNLTDVIDVTTGHSYFTYDSQHRLLTIEDPNQYQQHGALSSGPVLSNLYDAQNRVLQQTDPLGRPPMQFQYVTNGDGSQTTSITDPNGNVTTEQYLNNELQQRSTSVNGSPVTWSYQYDPGTLGVTQVTDPNQHVWTYKWDANGNLTQEVDPLQRTWKYTYTTQNDLQTAQDPETNLTTLGYNANGTVASISRPLGATTYGATPDVVSNGGFEVGMGPWSARSTTQSNVSVVTTAKQHSGTASAQLCGTNACTLTMTENLTLPAHFTAMTLGFWYFVTTSDSNPCADTVQVQIKYGGATPVNVPQAVCNSSQQNQWTSFSQDVTSALASYAGDTMQLIFTATTNATAPTTFYLDDVSLTAAGSNPTATWTEFLCYDDSNHVSDVTRIISPNGNPSNCNTSPNATSFAYNSNGDLARVTDPQNDQTTYTYDTIGRILTEVSPNGNVSGGNPSAFTTSFVTDALGRVTQVTDPLTNVTHVNYDLDGNVTWVLDARQNTTNYAYDIDNELQTITYQDQSTFGYTYDNNGNVKTETNGVQQATRYGYDALNRVTSMTDPLQRQYGYQYDGAGNLTQVIDPMSPQRTTTYGYDTADELTSISYSDGVTPNVSGITYTPDGQRSSMTDGTGTSSYAYDSLNRLIQGRDGAGKLVGYGYDLDGNVTGLTYPDGSQVLRQYDTADRLSQLTDWKQKATTFQYDSDSNLNLVTFPTTLNATTEVPAYNNADQLTGITDKTGNTGLFSFTYGRDPVGEVGSNADSIETLTHNFGYDTLNRLATDTRSDSSSATWKFDSADQLQSITDTQHNARNVTATYDPAGQLSTFQASVGGTPAQNLSFTFNNDGDRTSQTNSVPNPAQTTTLGYDQADRLTSVKPSSSSPAYGYAYNGDGMRMSKTVSGTTESYTWNLAEGLPTLIEDGTIKYATGPGGLPLEQSDSSGTILYYFPDQLGSTRGLVNSTGVAVATYTYDAYGNVKSKTGTATTPFRYAGQYTDTESGLQYLQVRYYDPATGQFINVDPLAAETGDPYAYVGGNALNGVDPSGLICFSLSCLRSVVASAAGTVAVTAEAAIGLAPTAAYAPPADPVQAACLYAQSSVPQPNTLLGIAFLVVPGLGEDEAGAAFLTVGDRLFQDLPRVGSAAKTDLYHRFPDLVDNWAGRAQRFPAPSDRSSGAAGTLYQLEGGYAGRDGVFEWIVRAGKVVHRRFIPGGRITGYANQRP